MLMDIGNLLRLSVLHGLGMHRFSHKVAFCVANSEGIFRRKNVAEVG